MCESEHRMTRAHTIGSRAWFELEKDIELGTPPHHVLSPSQDIFYEKTK